MKNYLPFTIIVFLFVSVTSMFGQTVQGAVYDEFSKPISFVSIYLKSNPYIGTSSNIDGTYSLVLEREKLSKNDVIIFSFIGYKTVERSINDFNADKKLIVNLIEQPIMLEGAAITAKVSRKASKAAKLSIIEKFRKQLEVDFPKVNKNYYVVSTVNAKKDNEVLMSNEIIGNIFEYPQMGRNERDSIRITKESIKEFTNNDIKEGLKKFIEKNRTDSISSNKKSKKQTQNSLSSTLVSMDNSKAEIEKRNMQLHRLLWGQGIKTLLKNLDNNIKNWNITYTNNNTILTYKEKKGFLGIVRMEMIIHFILDSYTYSVDKISSSTVAQVNIPFGYKLKQEHLDLLNIVNIGADQINKFRLKHINANIKQNVIYKNTNDGKFVDEKNLDAGISLEDNKEQELNYSSKALAKVISVKIIK